MVVLIAKQYDRSMRLDEKRRFVTVCYTLHPQILEPQECEQSNAWPNYNNNQHTSQPTRLSPADSTHSIEKTAPSLLPLRRAQAHDIAATASIWGSCTKTWSSATRILNKGQGYQEMRRMMYVHYIAKQRYRSQGRSIELGPRGRSRDLLAWVQAWRLGWPWRWRC